MAMLLVGAGIGLVVGAASGLITAVLELTLRRLANRARVRRDEPPLRNELAPPLLLPGAALGALAGGVAAPLSGWPVALAAAGLAPFTAWWCLKLAALVFVRSTSEQ